MKTAKAYRPCVPAPKIADGGGAADADSAPPGSTKMAGGVSIGDFLWLSGAYGSVPSASSSITYYWAESTISYAMQ